MPQSRIRIIPITFRQACAYVTENHRHNKAPRGHKFSIGALDETDTLVGVAMIGRPVARAWDDGLTAEVNRTCTDGTPNVNSALYGAAWRASKGMGYTRLVTYTQADEPGTSLHAAGWRRVGDRKARGSWADSTQDETLKQMRDPAGNGGVARVAWEITTR